MFSESVYLHSIYSGTVRDPLTVVGDFLADLRLARPVYVGENAARVFVTFNNGVRLAAYALPLRYKTFIREV